MTVGDVEPCLSKRAGLQDDVVSSVRLAQLRGKGGSSHFHDYLFKRRCIGLEEHQCVGKQWESIDKAFACAWLNNRQVVVGTKCNRLLLLNADICSASRLAPLQIIQLPRPPQRPVREPAQAQAVQNALWSVGLLLRSGQHRDHQGRSSAEGDGDEDNMVDTAEDMIATTIANLEPNPAPYVSPGQYGISNGGVQTGNCGIHCIALTPDRSLLACGGADPSDCQTYKLEESNSGIVRLLPTQTLVGHKDWIFGSAWVTDRHLVTGSRDKSLKLWSVDADSCAANTLPLKTQQDENGKVRDVKFLEQTQQVASLAVNGSVQILDAHLNKISLISTPYEREVVCMAAAGALLAVGSQNHISLVDSRMGAFTSAIPNVDHNHGVRSLAFCHNLLSVGGGQGKIHFFDLRMGKFLQGISRETLGNRGTYGHHIQTGEGYLARNSIYLEHFEGMEIRNACYGQAWDPSKTRLLTVGGPLAFGLSGNYAAIWS